MLALHGAYYNNNFGDLLILKLFENWLRAKVSSDIVYPMVSETEQARFKTHFPNALFGLEQSNYWKALVCAGGGYFGDPYPQSTLRLKILGTKWDKRFFEVHSRPIELCISKKIPYAIVGVEAGPLTNMFTRANSSQCLMWNDIDQALAKEKTDQALQMARSKASIIDENWHKIKDEALNNKENVSFFLDSL